MDNARHLLDILNLNLFQSRDAKAYRPLNPPLIFFVIVLVVFGFALYMLGDPFYEFQLRLSSLLIIGTALLIFTLSRWSDTFGRWAFAPVLSILIAAEALIWHNAQLLLLTLAPVALSAVLVNLPALLFTSFTNTILLMRLDSVSPALFPGNDQRAICIATTWLLAFVLIAGYFFFEQFIRRANEDQVHFQKLLEESRSQQLKLAQAMDDLLHANRQLTLLYDKNIHLRKAAEEAREAKTTYIARVSHEIRTPLTMILGITDCIIEDEEMEEDLPLELVDDLHVIRRNSEHLLSLVNDVLDLTRAEAGQLILKKEWVDINAEIEKAVEIVQPLITKKKLTLCIDPADGTTNHDRLPQVYCDRTRIRQVILNLLSNAVRYTNAGQVGVYASSDGLWLTVKVWDTGLGVQPDDIERIFDPFCRGATGLQQDTIGAGLGLSVSRQLVELHSGKIWLESKPGAGSTFYFTLPITVGDAPLRSPTGFINETWMWTERRRPKLNLQSDRKRVVLCGADGMLSEQFEDNRELELIQTNSVPELVEVLDNAPAHLVLMNSTSIPDLLEMLHSATTSIKDTPIIGSVFTPLRQYVLQAGAADFVQKPFSAAKLIAAVHAAVSNPREVLIVDDNAEVQQLIARMLAEALESTQFVSAANGAQAMQLLKTHQPDLILMDLLLPDTDGWHLMEEINKDAQISEIPIILISAHDPMEELPKSKLMLFARGDGIALDEFIHYALGNLA